MLFDAAEHSIPPAARRLSERIGVSRIARVTSLDRLGVEVACAVRPDGHVLQVCNGKGVSWPAAVQSALGEAAELWAAEAPAAVVCAQPARLEGDVWAPHQLGGDGQCVTWVKARLLSHGTVVWVPSSLVWCGPHLLQSACALSWSSNGMGASTSKDGALSHAVHELWEREALARVLPEGFEPRTLRRRRLEWRSPMTERWRDEGFDTWVFDLTPGAGDPPVAGALLVDREKGPVSLTAGYASRPTLFASVEAALLEAAQSRLTDIHGAREDVLSWSSPSSNDTEALLVELSQLPARRVSKRSPMTLKQTLRALGADVAVVELAEAPLKVVKVFARGFRVSELLQ